jgi:hypothetical protein
MSLPKGGCSFCAALTPYLGSDQTSNYLDREVRWKMRSLKSDGEMEILACPECGKYYFYREWTPGGSDDAMVTTYHQDFYELSPFGLYAQLCPAFENTEKAFLKREAVAVARGAIAVLKEKRSAKVHEVYREQVLAHERFAAEVLKTALQWLPEVPADLLADARRYCPEIEI